MGPDDVIGWDIVVCYGVGLLHRWGTEVVGIKGRSLGKLGEEPDGKG